MTLFCQTTTFTVFLLTSARNSDLPVSAVMHERKQR